jgi:hypothetical protein
MNGRDAVSKPAQENVTVILQSFRRPTLTQEQVFRLWRCAIKDDDGLVDEIIQQVYKNIIAFDRKRAECVIELIVGRSVAANRAFRSLLTDMRAGSDAASPFVSPPAKVRS